MDFQKSRFILQKINAHFQLLQNQAQISLLEKDLLLEYIRHFYDACAETGTTPKAAPVVSIKQESHAEVPPPPAPTPAIVSKVEVAVVEAPPAPSPPPAPKPQPVPVAVVMPPVQEEAAPIAIEPTPVSNKPRVSKSPEGAELFEVKEVKELSEKLSQAPIQNLSKALGINEKLQYINDLFAGDAKIFEETINELNSFNSVEQAQVFISEKIALRFDWLHKNRKDKAKEFIRLIRRRYI